MAKIHAPGKPVKNSAASYARLVNARILHRTDTGQYVRQPRPAPLPSLFNTPARMAASCGPYGGAGIGATAPAA